MFKIFQRKQIGDGIWFSSITDSRFKVNQISICLYTGFGELTRADYAAVPYILSDSCAAYPDYSRLQTRLSELYGASMSDGTTCTGNSRISAFSCTAIDDRYALEGERLTRESCSLLLSCLLDPRAENGAFNADITRVMKGELIDSIDSIINDKRSYAAQRGASFAYEGEPVGTDIQGTHDEAERITPQSAYRAYRDMLEHGRIEVFACGCNDFADIERQIAEAFSALPRKDIHGIAPLVSPLKPQTLSVTEKLPMNQSILRMYFKAPQLEDRFAGLLLGTVLGGMATSRFFTNIREKQSLCYYCSCFSNRFMRTLVAYAGVEPRNAGRAREAILAEIEDVQKNGVSAEELERAKLDLINGAKSENDSVSGLVSWYSAQIFDDEFMSPEEFAAKIEAVTPQRVHEAALLYSPDTFYTLEPEEAEK